MITAIHFVSREEKWILTSDKESYHEDESVVFTLTTTNVDEAGKNLRWVIDREEDVDPSVAVGDFILDANSNATWTLDLLEDYLTEGQETLNITVIDPGPDDGLDQQNMANYNISQYTQYASHSIIIKDSSISYVITANVTHGEISCNGSYTWMTVTPLTGVGPFTYKWTKYGTPGVLGTGQTFSYITNGLWTCRVTDSRGEVGDFVKGFTEPSLISTTSHNIDSTHITWDVSGGTAPYTTEIYNPAGSYTRLVTNTSNGKRYAYSQLTPNTTYYFRVTDDNGCVKTTNAKTLYSPFSIVGMQDATIACHGEDSTGTGITVTVIGGSGDHSINWTGAPNETSYTRQGLPAGTYVVSVTDNITGESDVTTFVISQPSQITHTATSTSTSISVSAAGGTGIRSISWLDSSTISFNRTGLSSNAIYYYTIEDENGCSVSGSKQTKPCQMALIAAEVTVTNPWCPGDDGSIEISSPNYAQSELDYDWSNGDTTFKTFDGQGSYDVTVSTNSGCGVVTETIEDIIIASPIMGVSASSTSNSVTVNAIGDPTYSSSNSITWSDSVSTSFSRYFLTSNTTYNYTVNIFYGPGGLDFCQFTGSITTQAQTLNNYYKSTVGYFSPLNFCGDSTHSITSAFWTTGADWTNLINKRIYTNSAGTTAFNGNNLYYLVYNNSTTVFSGAFNRWIRINSSGYVTDEGDSGPCGGGGPKGGGPGDPLNPE
jgi:hypothetical protein